MGCPRTSRANRASEGGHGSHEVGRGDPAERQPQSGGAPTPQGSRTAVTGEGSQAAMIPISKHREDNECLASPSRRRELQVWKGKELCLK